MLLNKEEAVLELEKRIEESSKTCEKKSEWVKEKLLKQESLIGEILQK